MIIIKLTNIQAIKEGEVHFDNNEIVEFIGDNSNGKSIITKVLTYICEGSIFTKKVRKDVINDESNIGEFYIIDTARNKVLGFILYREGTDSLIIWGNKDNPQQRRGVEGGLKEILYDFGFRIYQDGDVCLQLFPTWGAIPFITTSGKTNSEIYNDLISDKMAEEFLSLFDEITYKLFKLKNKELNEDIARVKGQINTINAFDYRPLEELAAKIETGLKELNGLAPINLRKYGRFVYVPPTLPVKVNKVSLKKLTYVPEISFRGLIKYDKSKLNRIVSIPEMNFNKVNPCKIPKITYIPDMNSNFIRKPKIDRIIHPGNIIRPFNKDVLTNLKKATSNYIQVLNNKCPTCGRVLINH